MGYGADGVRDFPLRAYSFFRGNGSFPFRGGFHIVYFFTLCVSFCHIAFTCLCVCVLVVWLSMIISARRILSRNSICASMRRSASVRVIFNDLRERSI